MINAPGIAKAMARFAAKVRFESHTGCVVWIAGTSTARAGEARHGAFSFNSKRWGAHRWAAIYIHGQEVEPGMEVVHTCDNTLCVQHVKAEYPIGNTRQHWLLVSMGYGDGVDDESENEQSDKGAQEDEVDIPFDVHPVPEWLKPFLEEADDEVPF